MLTVPLELVSKVGDLVLGHDPGRAARACTLLCSDWLLEILLNGGLARIGSVGLLLFSSTLDLTVLGTGGQEAGGLVHDSCQRL